jgi:CDP-diacylglycerol---serine O-phosphatidyltransferase
MTDPSNPRRGTYLLPTFFTAGNLFFGFYSLVQAARGNFEMAAVLIILAGVLDGLDGRIARLTGTTSEFGLQFDSLADVVSFGIAPAFLAYQWSLWPLRQLGLFLAFLFVVCAAMRLARFNLQTHASDRRYFAGLPSPPAAGAVAVAAYAFPHLPDERWVAMLVAVVVLGISGLMITTRLRYRSFKDLDLRSRRSYLIVLPVAAALVAVVTHPKQTLLALAAIYLLSAPLAYLWGWVRDGRSGGRATTPGETGP